MLHLSYHIWHNIEAVRWAILDLYSHQQSDRSRSKTHKKMSCSESKLLIQQTYLFTSMIIRAIQENYGLFFLKQFRMSNVKDFYYCWDKLCSTHFRRQQFTLKVFLNETKYIFFAGVQLCARYRILWRLLKVLEISLKSVASLLSTAQE